MATVDGDGRLSMVMVDGDGRLSMVTVDCRWRWSTIDSDSDDYGRQRWQWMVMTRVGDQRRVAMLTTGKGKSNATVTTTPSSNNY